MKLLILILSFFLSISQINAQEMGIVTGTNVSVRAQPDVNSELLGKAQQGAVKNIYQKTDEAQQIGKIEINGKHFDFKWYQIDFNGQKGWIFGAYFFELYYLQTLGLPLSTEGSEQLPWSVSKPLQLYQARVDGEGEMGYQQEFFVLLTQKNDKAKSIPLYSSHNIYQYRQQLSNSGMVLKNQLPYVGFNEKNELILSYHIKGFCELCNHLYIWKGKYDEAQKGYMLKLEQKYETN